MNTNAMPPGTQWLFSKCLQSTLVSLRSTVTNFGFGPCSWELINQVYILGKVTGCPEAWRLYSYIRLKSVFFLLILVAFLSTDDGKWKIKGDWKSAQGVWKLLHLSPPWTVWPHLGRASTPLYLQATGIIKWHLPNVFRRYSFSSPLSEGR